MGVFHNLHVDSWMWCVCVGLFMCVYVLSHVSDSLWPHEQQPTRRLCPGDSPGKNPGVGCHFLLQCVWTFICIHIYVCISQFCSVDQLCLTLWDPMDCNTPDLPVHHQLPGFTQTHVHRVSDAIQPSHPLLSPSPPAFNLSHHQSLLQWVSSSHQVAKILELQLQHESFQWIFRTDFLWDWLVWSPYSPRDSLESPLTPQFKSINSSVLSFL